MSQLTQFMRLAFLNLRRGGQRVLVVWVCISFGIMALVAMNMVANSIKGAVEVSPAELLGGDLSIGRKLEDTLSSADIAQIQAMQQTGAISRFTLIDFRSSLLFHSKGSGEMHFIANALGIQPDSYPLAGSLRIGEPTSTSLPALLRQVGDVVVTRDVAEESQLKVGDAIVLSDLSFGMAVEGVVRGIAYDTPNHMGEKIYYSLETARQLSGGQPVVNTVMANTSQPQAVKGSLESSGWGVNWVAGSREDGAANVWVLGLRGAGILGLLVGGIGIAHTMQVLLHRRQREIAIWKTLGYQAGHLRQIFMFEAGLLGLAGSLPGAGLGVLLSSGLLELFRRTSSLLYQWTFSTAPLMMGILVGTLSTVVFAGWAIALASGARPLALLRNERIEVPALARAQSLGLALVLLVSFIALTSLIMESVWGGIAVLVGIGMGLAGLGGLFSLLLWACSRLLPLRGLPLLRMGIHSLRRRGLVLVFAMIALFVGVLSMSAGLAVMQKTTSAGTGGSPEFESYNLTVLAGAGQADAVLQAIQAQGPQKQALGYRAALARITTPEGETASRLDPVLVGRTDPVDYQISGSAWGSQSGGVYAYQYSNLKAGSQVQVTFPDGSQKSFPVVGSYDIPPRSIQLYPPTGLLMSAEGFQRAAQADALTVFVQVPSNQISQASSSLVKALPNATVINLVAYAARFMQSYQDLYALPMVLAGLALLAGFLLVANSVSLAMLDRRYEIGIFKTVGYTRRQILTIFAVEYGWAGLLATAAGVLIVQALLAAIAIGAHLPASYLLLTPPSLLLIGLCGIGLTLATVLAVSWQPTGVSPLAVLSERE